MTDGVLELYAENLRKDFPCSDHLIETIKKSNRQKITMAFPPIPESGEEDGD